MHYKGPAQFLQFAIIVAGLAESKIERVVKLDSESTKERDWPIVFQLLVDSD